MSFYVDCCISSLSSEKQAEFFFRKHSSKVLNKAGMELRKWRGNAIKSSKDAGNKVLGVVWKLPLDVLQVKKSGSRHQIIGQGELCCSGLQPYSIHWNLFHRWQAQVKFRCRRLGRKKETGIINWVQRWLIKCRNGQKTYHNFRTFRYSVGLEHIPTKVMSCMCFVTLRSWHMGVVFSVVIENEQHLLFSKGEVAPL